jgi:tetratricopeptide (TPR) repeat protein
MHTRSLLALILLSSACDRGSKDPPVAQPVAAASTTATAPAATATAASTTTTAPAATPPKIAAPVRRSAKERASAGFDRAAAKAQASSFREQLAAGRQAVKDKKYAEGIAALEAALKIDPNHAATLAELGWAAYLAGDLDKARRNTELAIAGDASDRTRGAALYNLGRILEDRGDKDGAAAAYQRSLALRPNDVVQQRLGGLTAAGATTVGHECDFEARPGRPPQDLCAALVRTLATDELFSGHECVEGDTEPGEVAVDAGGTPYGGEPQTKIDLEVDGIKVAHFGVRNLMEMGGSDDALYLAVLHADRWSLISLGSAYNPGIGYIGESFEIAAVEAKDVVPGGRPEVVITLARERHDGDYGANSSENSSDRIVTVLGLDGDAPRWLGAFEVSAVEETAAMLDDEPSEVTPKRSERKLDHRFDAATGEVELVATTGFEAPGPLGRFKLGALPAACPAGLGFLPGG